MLINKIIPGNCYKPKSEAMQKMGPLRVCQNVYKGLEMFCFEVLSPSIVSTEYRSKSWLT